MSTGFKEPLVHSTTSNQAPYPYRSGMGMVNSAEWIVFFDDFTGVTSSNAPTGWTAIIDTGATAVDGAEHGGVIDISSDGADEGVGLYLPKSIQLGGKKFFMEARVKVEDADDNIVAFGLSDLVATTDPEDLYDTSNADGISFGTTTDGDATPKLVYDKNNGGPVTNTPTGTGFDLSDATWHTLGIFYNGATTADDTGFLGAYVDGNLATSAGTDAQIPDDVPLAPFVAALVEDDATDIISIDFVRFAIQR
jgi:hypothetical protein